MADAHETARHDMEQEAAEKLGNGQAQFFVGAPRGVVFVAQADVIVLDGDDALVREGDAVGVAGEIVQDLPRAGRQRVPSGWRPPPVTMQCRWTWSTSVCDHVWSTAVTPSSAPR